MSLVRSEGKKTSTGKGDERSGDVLPTLFDRVVGFLRWPKFDVQYLTELLARSTRSVVCHCTVVPTFR